MLIEKISKKELDFITSWYNPVTLAECLFDDFDNLGHFDKKAYGKIRKYQLPMLSYESIYDFKAMQKYHELSDKQTFDLRKNIGDLYNLGARLFGKSLISLIIDIALSALYEKNLKALLYSIDEKRLRGILTAVEKAMKYHPIFKIFYFICRYKPAIKFYGRKNNWTLHGVNMHLSGKSPGSAFYQLHVDKMWGDEISFENEEIYKKRRDSCSELGSIFRLAGMTNFLKHSPIGKIFFDPINKDKILNLPRYVNPTCSDKDILEAEKDYGGKESLNFRIYFEGEVAEDAFSTFDMERVKFAYLKNREIKRFELKKEQFENFKNLIIVERPKNIDRIFICSDVGDGAGGSDIIILSEIGDKYYLLYNIILYNMTEQEQYEIFKYLVEQTQANVLGFDCGEACGRGLYDKFEKAGYKKNLVWYRGNDKVISGFEQDANKSIKLDKKGKPIVREEFMSEWVIKRLKILLYEPRLFIPEKDYKFDNQFSSVISTKSDTRTTYECISETGDHYWSAFRVFSIAQWLKKDFNTTPNMTSEIGLGISSLRKKIEDIKETKEEIINKIHQGKLVNCDKSQFDKYVRTLLLERANYYTFRGDTTRASIAVSELKRLTKKFETIKGE